MAGSYETERSATVVLGHNGLEIGGGLVLRLTLAGSPFHEKAVAEAAEHSDEPNAAGGLYPATIVIVRYVQALVSPVFNPPAIAIELEPFQGGQAFRFDAGD